MDALLLGLGAALLWGLHDFTVRFVGSRTDALVLLAGVFLSGALLLAPLALATGWQLHGPRGLGLSVLAGVAYMAAGYGLYRALSIGPVYLVAPICGAFPMVSVALELARGGSVTIAAWLGAAVILGGIALVARGEADASTGGTRKSAILWAVVSCFGFAFTFALSQWAAEAGAPLQVALVARTTATLIALASILALRPAIAPTLRSWRPMLLLGLLDVSALTTVTLAGGLPHAEYASVAASIFGVVTILLAWRFLGERLGPVQWLGCVLVFGGIAALGLTGQTAHG